jgi:hypothetical protein
MYANSMGHTVVLMQTTSSSQLTVDTENAEYTKELKINSCNAILVKKDKLTLVWIEPQQEIMYSLVADTLDEAELITIAEKLLLQYLK